MPDLQPSLAELPDGPPEEPVSERFAAVQRVLGEWEGYWTTSVVHGDETREAVMLSLSDDLTDIWRDLEQGLLALDSHRGRHATEAPAYVRPSRARGVAWSRASRRPRRNEAP